MQPNPPINRFDFVAKTYAKQPWVVLDTLSVIFNTVGIDEPWRVVEEAERRAVDPEVRRRCSSLLDDSRQLVLGLPTLTSYMSAEDQITYASLTVRVSEWRAAALARLIDVVRDPDFADGLMREPHDAEKVFPWVAREISRLSKFTIREIDRRAREKLDIRDTYRTYEQAILTLRARTNHIAAWAKAKHVDLMKLSLAEALEGSEHFIVRAAVPQGKVVYRFKSGWTVQELRGRSRLDPEGRKLSHCVGSYCKRVESGEDVIYSLRDPMGCRM